MLVGNLTNDPELEYTKNGTATARFRLAVTPRIREADGSWRNGDTSFFTVNTWRDPAENVAHPPSRRRPRRRRRPPPHRSWVTEAGAKRSITELEADEVAPSLRFAIVKDITKPERIRETTARQSSRADDADVPF